MCNTSLSVGIIGIYTVRYSDSSDTCERLLLTTLKQVLHLSERHLVDYLAFFQLVLYVLCYSLCILSNCIHIVASSPKRPVSVFEL